nr:MAG TPA: hypothetical protein [Caudoviricetes sp.]
MGRTKFVEILTRRTIRLKVSFVIQPFGAAC